MGRSAVLVVLLGLGLVLWGVPGEVLAGDEEGEDEGEDEDEDEGEDEVEHEHEHEEDDEREGEVEDEDEDEVEDEVEDEHEHEDEVEDDDGRFDAGGFEDEDDFEDSGDPEGYQEPTIEPDGRWIPPRAATRKIPKWARSRGRVRAERNLGFGVGGAFIPLGILQISLAVALPDAGYPTMLAAATGPIWLVGGIALIVVGVDMIVLERIMELRGYPRYEPRERTRGQWAFRWGPSAGTTTRGMPVRRR